MSDPPTIRGYEIGELLGEGAHARVHRATDARGRELALKILRRRADEDATGTARLLREAEILRTLDHPNVVRSYGAGTTTDGRPYLAMERVEGESLHERVAREGPLEPTDAWSIVRAVADGLASAHARGVLHRDLKASNVLLDTRGRAKLGDFGLAKRAEDPQLSRDGASTGTPATMAPEQWWGAGIDERTDVYGLGAILYEALCAAPPWQAREGTEDAADLLHRVATEEPPLLSERLSERSSERRTKLPVSVEDLVRRCLAREPSRRPPDVEAFLREGDAAFGRRDRWRASEPLAWGLAALSIPLVLGFAGTHDPITWMREAGWGSYAIGLSFPLAAFLSWRFVGARPFAPLLPLVQGAAGFATGMMTVGAFVASADAETRFVMFHVGVAEASTGWFLGACASASVLAMVAVIDLPLARPSRRALVVAAVLTLGGLLSADLGGAAACVFAAALVLRGALARAPHALAALGATLTLGLAAWVRLAGASARLWDTDLDRAARALALAELGRAQLAVLGAVAVGALALVVAAPWRGLRAWPRRRVIYGVVGAALTFAALALPWLSMQREEARLAADLATRFSVWAELDPPAGSGEREARLGPTLQIGRARIALDGEVVLPTDALARDSPTVTLVLAQRLGARLDPSATPALVIAADRSLPFALVARALRVANELGVRRVDVLLLPGAPLRLSPSAPAEAAMVLPGDLRSLDVELSSDEGLAPESGATFAEVVSTLERAPGHRLRL